MADLMEKINPLVGISLAAAVGITIGISLNMGMKNAELKHEYTKVVGKEYTPGKSVDDISGVLFFDFNPIGVFAAGKRKTSERYELFLECKDGRIFGYRCQNKTYANQEVSGEIYNELNIGQDLDISYKDFLGLHIKIKPVSK
jgi:hypothetical protein